MLTRQYVTANSHETPGAPPPLHAAMYYHQHAPGLSRDELYGSGGLLGGAVTLTASGFTGMKVGNTGYGYLGLDPSAPDTWTRRFNPAPGMVGRLNVPCEGFQVYPQGGGQMLGQGG